MNVLIPFWFRVRHSYIYEYQHSCAILRLNWKHSLHNHAKYSHFTSISSKISIRLRKHRSFKSFMKFFVVQAEINQVLKVCFSEKLIYLSKRFRKQITYLATMTSQFDLALSALYYLFITCGVKHFSCLL